VPSADWKICRVRIDVEPLYTGLETVVTVPMCCVKIRSQPVVLPVF
jgi:hypothetical protein